MTIKDTFEVIGMPCTAGSRSLAKHMPKSNAFTVDLLVGAGAIPFGKTNVPLFAGDLDGEGIVEPAVYLPQMSEGENVVEDYVAMRLTLRTHPVALIRHHLSPGIDPRLLTPTVNSHPKMVAQSFPPGRADVAGGTR